jgi:hypothetical protein
VPFESINDVSVILVPAKRMILGNAGMTRNVGLGGGRHDKGCHRVALTSNSRYPSEE